MRNYCLFSVLLIVLISSGCKKEKNENEDFQQILTSTSWEEIDSVYDGQLYIFRSLYIVTFDATGEFEIIYRQWGVLPLDSILRDSTNRQWGANPLDPILGASTNRIIRLDTIFGKYSFLNSENKIIFKPRKIKVVGSDTTNIFHDCDTIQYFIADWQIQKINSNRLQTHGLNPDITNHSNCFMIEFLGDYNLRPYKK